MCTKYTHRQKKKMLCSDSSVVMENINRLFVALCSIQPTTLIYNFLIIESAFVQICPLWRTIKDIQLVSDFLLDRSLQYFNWLLLTAFNSMAYKLFFKMTSKKYFC